MLKKNKTEKKKKKKKSNNYIIVYKNNLLCQFYKRNYFNSVRIRQYIHGYFKNISFKH